MRSQPFRVLMAFDYLRIDGWMVPPDEPSRSTSVRCCCIARTSALYFQGILHRDHHRDAQAAARCFHAVAGAGWLVRHALGEVGRVDGETEDLVRQAELQIR